MGEAGHRPKHGGREIESSDDFIRVIATRIQDDCGYVLAEVAVPMGDVYSNTRKEDYERLCDCELACLNRFLVKWQDSRSEQIFLTGAGADYARKLLEEDRLER
jgi:hypothetical protein